MKKTIPLVTLLGIILFSACTSLKHIDGYEQLTGLDFRPYAEKGFLITPYAYTGEYISVYMVNYVIMPEATYEESPEGRDGTVKATWVQEVVDIEMALDGIYNKCVSLGADALMDFKIEVNSDTYNGITNPAIITGIKITGIAIIRNK